MRKLGLRRIVEIGGVAAGTILIAMGIATVVLAANGRSTVRDSLKNEYVVGSEDMNPKTIADEAKAGGLSPGIALPTCDVAGKPITNGDRARCFASYMRIHTLLSTGGKTYAQLPRYATADGAGTNDALKAKKDAAGKPLDNPARQLWVTETAISTALNVSYLAEQISLFSVVVAVALVLSGVGFVVIALAGALRRPREAIAAARQRATQPIAST